MKAIVLLILSVVLTYAPQASAYQDYSLVVCDACSDAEMQSRVKYEAIENRTVEVQVVNPSTGVVKAFKVLSISEPGFEDIDIYPAAVRSDVVSAASEAKGLIRSMRATAASNSDIIQRVQDIYPDAISNQVSLQLIPSSLVASAMDVTSPLGENAAHLSQYLGTKIGTPSFSLVDLIMRNVVGVAIAVFDDGSIMLFIVDPLSTHRWKVFTDYKIDSDGKLRTISGALVTPGTASSSGGGSSGGSSGSSSGTVIGATGGGNSGHGGTGWCFVQTGQATYCWKR